MTFRKISPPADRTVRLSEAARAVACSTCEAWPGQPCTREAGVARVWPHPARMLLVDKHIGQGGH